MTFLFCDTIYNEKMPKLSVILDYRHQDNNISPAVYTFYTESLHKPTVTTVKNLIETLTNNVINT